MRVDGCLVDTKKPFLRVAEVYRLVYVIAMMGTLFWASAQEKPEIVPALNLPDKWAHFLAYGLLGTLILRTRWFWGRGTMGIVMAVAVASVYGICDEWHQSYVPGRYPDVMDWIADTFGALLATTLYTKWTIYRKFLEYRLFVRRKSGIEVEKNGGINRIKKDESSAGGSTSA